MMQGDNENIKVNLVFALFAIKIDSIIIFGHESNTALYNNIYCQF